jgi:hypothetical protein
VVNGGPELDPKLTRLLDEAKRSSDFPEERREALFARVAAHLPGGSAVAEPEPKPASEPWGRAPSTTTSTSTLPARLAKAGALVLLGGALGYGVARVPPSSSPPSPVPPAVSWVEGSREPTPSSSPFPSSSSPVASSATPAAPVTSGLGATSASRRTSPTAPAPEPAPSPTNAGSATTGGIDSVRTTLAEERSLVERGRAAIARRDAVSALEALSDHERTFPSGVLAEERDALRIQALALAGRGADARRRAREFAERHPNSVFLGRVDETVRALPP